MPLRLNGATSGYVQLAAPAVAGSTSLVLPTDSVQPGLVLVATSSFTTASTVSVDGCFTATYDSYRILISGLSGSVNDSAVNLRLRVSAADNSTGNYSWAWGYAGSSTAGGAGSRTGTAAQIAATSSTVDGGASIDIRSPQLAAKTTWSGQSSQDSGTNTWSYQIGGTFNATTQFDGFTIYPASGTITGTLAVYGYRSSITT